MQTQQETGGFDFDEWAELARSDPQAFELKRTNTIEAVIDSAPRRNRQQLRRVQWKLDRIRETSATPLAACIRMQELMWESMLGDNGLLEQLQRLSKSLNQARHSDSILEFRRQ